MVGSNGNPNHAITVNPWDEEAPLVGMFCNLALLHTTGVVVL